MMTQPDLLYRVLAPKPSFSDSFSAMSTGLQEVSCPPWMGGVGGGNLETTLLLIPTFN